MKTVAIDLAPANYSAPGTARYVAEQSKALKKHPANFQWLPIFDDSSNPIYSKWKDEKHLIVPGKSAWLRSTFSVANITSAHQLFFGTAYFVPRKGRCIANFFDSNIYEHFNTWIQSGRFLNACLIRLLCNFAILRAKKLFILSKYCSDYLKRKFPSQSEKFIVTCPGISPPYPKPINFTPDWAISSTNGFILYVGTFSENKNQTRLIEAFIKLKKLYQNFPSLVLVGPCPSDFLQKRIQPLLKNIPSDWIILPGRIPDEELAWAYYNALAYIQPSIAEGFGLPVVEAMSYGLPVACSNTTSLPETAGDAALLFNPFQIDSIAKAVKTIVSDNNLRLELKEKSLKRWRQFTWEKNASLIISEIEKIL